jgi:phosphatidate cytidylyltransferase
MLRKRLWAGAVLVGLTVLMLTLDHGLAPWHPFLLLVCQLLGHAGCLELRSLLPERPSGWLCHGGVSLVLLANWPARVLPAWGVTGGNSWHWVLGVFVAVVLLAFVVEMIAFRKRGEGAVVRIALVVLTVAYLGLLPSFLAQLSWLPHGSVALALALFVPKANDVAAYTAGRLFGRHPMTPLLSPKKTWEGFAGGMLGGVLAAVGIQWLAPTPLLPLGDAGAVGFGLTVGLAGVLGDLAESMIKRDAGLKDASQTVPGFGGILDVLDSIVFAAPVAYCWLSI